MEGQGNHESSEESDFELDDVEDEPIAKKSRQEEVKEALAKACWITFEFANIYLGVDS